MRVTHLIIAIGLVATPALAQSDRGPTSRGSKLVGGSASLSRMTEKETDQSFTGGSINPNVLFFIAPRFAIGGQLGFSYLDSSQGHSSGWVLGPAARLFFGSGNARTLPFIGAAILKGGSSSENEGVAGTLESEASTWELDGSAGLTFMLSRQVGLTGEGFVSRRKSTLENSVFPDSDRTQTNFGLRFGFSAFLF